MAEPTSFDEVNCQLSAPPQNKGIEPLLCHRDVEGDQVISCWRLTKEELEEINKTGRVWLHIMGTQIPPAVVSGIKPFPSTNKEKPE